MPQTTVFRRAAWVVAWAEAHSGHVYRRDLDLMVRDREIVFLGKNCPETGDVEIDCSERLLLPGLINIHTHPSSEPLRTPAKVRCAVAAASLSGSGRDQ